MQPTALWSMTRSCALATAACAGRRQAQARKAREALGGMAGLLEDRLWRRSNVQAPPCRGVPRNESLNEMTGATLPPAQGRVNRADDIRRARAGAAGREGAAPIGGPPTRLRLLLLEREDDALAALAAEAEGHRARRDGDDF